MMDRRDFFGVIATPLLRQFAPPMPVAGNAAGRLRLESYRMSDLPMVPGVHVDIKSHCGDDLEALRDMPALLARAARRIEERRIVDMLR